MFGVWKHGRPMVKKLQFGDSVMVVFEPDRPNEFGFYHKEGIMGYVHFVGVKKAKNSSGWWVPLDKIVLMAKK
jgi:hypothetical protein